MRIIVDYYNEGVKIKWINCMRHAFVTRFSVGICQKINPDIRAYEHSKGITKGQLIRTEI